MRREDEVEYKKFYYKNYELRYEVYKKEDIWVSSVVNYEDENDIIFSDIDKERCEKYIKEWFKTIVDEYKTKEYMAKSYSIDPYYEDILYSVRDIPVGYHISLTINRDGILDHGLIANGSKDMTVLKASNIMDSIKPIHVPEWVRRSNSVYLHPNIDNFKIADRIYKNCDLYAVSINPSLCWVGSIGLGGFCLFDEDFTPNQEAAHVKQVRRYGKLYWKFSCSLEEYIQNTQSVKKKDSYYGLDEILVMYPIKTEDIKLIGFWDKDGVFYKTNHFKDYIKPKFLDNYKEIIDAYIY